MISSLGIVRIGICVMDPFRPYNTTRTFVDGRQIRVHVTRIATTTWHFFTSSRDLTKSITVCCQISKNDQDVLLQLVGIVFGGGKGKARSNDTFDPGLN